MPHLVLKHPPGELLVHLLTGEAWRQSSRENQCPATRPKGSSRRTAVKALFGLGGRTQNTTKADFRI